MGRLFNLDDARKKVNKKKLIMDILFTIILIYIVYAVYLIIKTPTDTFTVMSGNLTVEESATGFIVRDETVIKGKNYKNGINQILLEGEKAAKKQTIFRYYGKNENELQDKINNVNEKIQKALEKENSFLYSDIKNLDEQIDKQAQFLRETNDVKILLEYKKQITNVILKKATIAGENSKRGSYIKKLIEQREKYEKQLIKGSEYINSPKSGIVSYRVDGLENVLKVKGIDDLTEQKLNDLDIKTGEIVSASNEEAKVIDNFKCYLVTFIDVTQSKQIEEGKKVKITLASGTEVDAIIEKIKEQENGKYLIVFKLNTLTDELMSYRKISFNITWWSVGGIKVPNDAILADENDTKYVLKKKSTGTIKSYVKILKTNESYSIISSYNEDDLKSLGIDVNTYEGIKVYDNILLYPKK